MNHDEELLKAKKAARLEEEQALKREIEKQEDKISIYDEAIRFDNRDITFSRRIMEDLGISMYMPDELKLIDKNIAQLMFPNAKDPFCAYSSEWPLMNITISRTADKVSQSNISTYLAFQKKIMETVGPNVKITKTYEKTVRDEITFGIMEFYSKALDGSLFNIIALHTIYEGLELIGFNIQSHHADILKPLILEMVESYEILQEGEFSV